MARGAGLAGRVSSHKRTACDINVVMQRQPWQLKLGAGTQEHQRLQRLNGVCKLLHLRRPGVAAPSRKCCDGPLHPSCAVLHECLDSWM